MDSFILLDYDTLRIIWWLLLGVLLALFAVMDGADIGVAMLLPAVAKTDDERRVLYNVIGPVWEGNQVWLILGGGAIFAAWPVLYAMAFSGFYLAMLLLLVALIVRPVAIKYRSKMESQQWRNRWDAIWCLSGVVSALVFGVAIGNVLLGVPFGFDPETLRPLYTGSFFGLFTPFALLTGVVSILLLAFQGAVVLSWKTDGVIAQRATRCARITGLLMVLLFIGAGVWVAYGLDGQVVTSALVSDAFSNPLSKTVEVTGAGGWMLNFSLYSWMWLAPIIAVLTAVAAVLIVSRGSLWAVFFSSVSVIAVVLTFGFALFPFLLPSSSQPDAGLTIYDASASHLTLWVMLLVTCIFLPMIIAYTSWVYSVMRGKVTADSVHNAPHSY
ncbi:cytochrome d ubiquinol oxidase subunit II [Paenalcaligenes sp. Me131]|uniref:cytochrome d ubiquinol oxidase subunit II n=1 Tax=Paenalcaligenes sp. Me131 TaxID=3392636 RepID=UPI003D2791EE